MSDVETLIGYCMIGYLIGLPVAGMIFQFLGSRRKPELYSNPPYVCIFCHIFFSIFVFVFLFSGDLAVAGVTGVCYVLRYIMFVANQEELLALKNTKSQFDMNQFILDLRAKQPIAYIEVQHYHLKDGKRKITQRDKHYLQLTGFSDKTKPLYVENRRVIYLNLTHKVTWVGRSEAMLNQLKQDLIAKTKRTDRSLDAEVVT